MMKNHFLLSLVFFVATVLSMTMAIPVKAQGDQPTPCAVEFIKWKIGEMERLIRQLWELDKRNARGTFTPDLRDGLEDLCQSLQKIRELRRAFPKCEISEHNKDIIAGTWASLLKFFEYKNIDFIMNQYHPQGYCQL
jgi:hypothetical protein